jgi:hypothetical protein
VEKPAELKEKNDLKIINVESDDGQSFIFSDNDSDNGEDRFAGF